MINSSMETSVQLQFMRKKGKLLVDGRKFAHDTHIINAVARAIHWNSLLDAGIFKSVSEIARAEEMLPSTVARLLRLARLAPDIIEQFMMGIQPRRLTLQWLIRNHIPALWSEQRQMLEQFNIGETMPKKGHISQIGPAVTREIPSPDGGVQLVTTVPLEIISQRVKKQIIPPPDAPPEFLDKGYIERPVHKKARNSALMRALGLAHYWRRLLDAQRMASAVEIAKAEGIDVTQVRRILRLTLLAPTVIERLMGEQVITLEQVIRRTWPNDWSAQLRHLQELAPQT